MKKMVEIIYLKSISGSDSCFDLLFGPLHDFIPDEVCQSEAPYTWSAYEYYMWLFKKRHLFRNSDQGIEYIESVHWDCEVDGIPFTMVYDNDYDIVSFSVEEAFIPYRKHIAEELKRIIEEEAERVKQ